MREKQGALRDQNDYSQEIEKLGWTFDVLCKSKGYNKISMPLLTNILCKSKGYNKISMPLLTNQMTGIYRLLWDYKVGYSKRNSYTPCVMIMPLSSMQRVLVSNRIVYQPIWNLHITPWGLLIGQKEYSIIYWTNQRGCKIKSHMQVCQWCNIFHNFFIIG